MSGSHSLAEHDAPDRQGRVTFWTAAGVALGAAALTAHGLYEVALGADIPPGLAWLYPVVTDGLALVAYAVTERLRAVAKVYAWSVVVVCAGLSALAQAVYLAGGVAAATVETRFVVGAWPAVAAAVTAHLLYLIRSTMSREAVAERRARVQAARQDRAEQRQQEMDQAELEHKRALERLREEAQAQAVVIRAEKGGPVEQVAAPVQRRPQAAPVSRPAAAVARPAAPQDDDGATPEQLALRASLPGESKREKTEAYLIREYREGRPCKAPDAARALGYDRSETSKHLRRLEAQGRLRPALAVANQ